MKAKPAAYPYLIYMLIFIIVPLLIVAWFAFTNRDGKISFENLAGIGQYSNVFLRSLLLALVSTVVCFLVGYPVAFILSRMKKSTQNIMMLLIMLPMWINFLLRTYAWLTLLENNGLINSFLQYIHLPPIHIINTQAAVILGMVYNYLPFMILPIYNILTKMDHSMIEAAQDLGANPKKVFMKLTLPLSLPGVMSGITMVFVPAISTFIISSMLGGSGNLLIGDLIDLQFSTLYNPNLGAAISFVLMIIILIAMGIMRQFDDEDMDVVVI